MLRAGGRIKRLAPSPARLPLAVAASAALACPSVGAQAQGKLEARYTASLAGIPLGSGIWVIDIAPDQYTAVASGRTTGLVKLISDGSGSGGSRGTVQGASMVPTSYASSTITDKRADEVRMTLARRHREGRCRPSRR